LADPSVARRSAGLAAARQLAIRVGDAAKAACGEIGPSPGIDAESDGGVPIGAPSVAASPVVAGGGDASSPQPCVTAAMIPSDVITPHIPTRFARDMRSSFHVHADTRSRHAQ